MRVKQLRPEEFELVVSGDEFRLIVNALRAISSAVAGFEFYARLGFTPEQAKAMSLDIHHQAEESGLEL